MSDKERKEEMREPAALLLVLAGLFAMAGGVFDWEWFMNNRKAQAFVNWLGRGGARVFYVILGLAIAILGLLITFGVVASGR
jgi:drug/metabolite transporter superfamily protein YnfA